MCPFDLACGKTLVWCVMDLVVFPLMIAKVKIYAIPTSHEFVCQILKRETVKMEKQWFEIQKNH